MRASGHSAVMAQRGPLEIAREDPRTALMRRLELFPTPPWAVRAGAEIVRRLDPGAASVWEPCCGLGHMASALRESFPMVSASDVHDWGWGGQDAVCDFLSPDAEDLGVEVDWVITNPPFTQAAEMVRLGLQRARRGVAVLQRLQWLGSGRRHDLFFGAEPLSLAATFFERPAHHLGRWEPNGSTATDYAWFVWLKPEALVEAALRQPGITAASGYLGVAIPPGTRDRLTRADDARLWGAAGDAPLFEGLVEEGTTEHTERTEGAGA